MDENKILEIIDSRISEAREEVQESDDQNDMYANSYLIEQLRLLKEKIMSLESNFEEIKEELEKKFTQTNTDGPRDSYGERSSEPPEILEWVREKL